jgi:hypothetical protein
MNVWQADKNNGQALVTWLCSAWGVGHTREKVDRYSNNLGINGHMWQWRVTKKRDLLWVLCTIEPYLIVKRARALSAIDTLRAELEVSFSRLAWAEDEDAQLRALWGKRTARQVARVLLRSVPAVRERAKLLSLPGVGKGRWNQTNKPDD